MRTLAPEPKSTQQAASVDSSIRGRRQLRQNYQASSIQNLQSTMGNQAVQRLLGADAQNFIQPKLAIGKVNDPLEHEADRIANQALRMEGPDLSHSAPRHVQNAHQLQRNAAESGASGVDGRVASEILALHGGGSPLPKTPLAFFESRFGYDFTKVRIHSDSHAARLAQSVNARAFTLGQDIVFGSGEYSTETGNGTQLLAHELVHVMQQQASPAVIQRQPRGLPSSPLPLRRTLTNRSQSSRRNNDPVRNLASVGECRPQQI